MTMHSKSLTVWATTDATASAGNPERPQVGKITLNRGLVIADPVYR
jgi:hypothetical protein